MAKKSLKEKLKEKAQELRTRGNSGNIFFLKADSKVRIRILNVGEEEEFIKEVSQFYLGEEIKGVISPVTFDEPCAIYEEYQKLASSKDAEDKELAKKFSPKKKYLAYCLIYKDMKGKEVDESSPKFVLLTSGVYQTIIELFLDEEEWGDMTRPDEEGYDLKISRTGSGKNDTEYTVTPCSKSALPKEFKSKVFDLDKEVKKIIPSYEETKDYLDKFLGNSSDDDEDDDDKPKKNKKKKEDLPSKKVIKRKK